MAKLIFLCCVMAFYLFGFFSNGYAEQLDARVLDTSGTSIHEAVVFALPQSFKVDKGEKPAKAVVDQVDKEFIAHITPVFIGTAVEFPNNDKIRHHVYSFSPSKKFEIPLYRGMPPNPIIFDKAGAISIGCNIHDWMSANVYVLKTPFFASTGSYGAAIINLPPGDYDVQIWHPRLRGPVKKTSQRITVRKNKTANLEFSIRLKTAWKPRRAPQSLNSRAGWYR